MSEKSEETAFPIDPVEMLQVVLDNIPGAIFWKDKNSVFLGCNYQVAKAAGLESSADIVGKTDYDLAWKKEEADFFVKTDREVMARGTPELGIIEPLQQADGKQAWLETNKVPLFDPAGNVIGILGTYTDITERVQATEKLKAHAADLEFKNDALEQFAYIAAHDLQEPLKTMTGLASYFQKHFEDKLDEDASDIIQYMLGASERMQLLISGLLDYAQIGRNISMTEVNAYDVVQEVLLDLGHEIEESGAVIEVGPLPTIYASHIELKSVFQNLLANAIKFRKPNEAPRVQVFCKLEDSQWHFSIQDNGIGIDAAFQEKVFLIYQRLTKRSEYEGTGIGLTHCKKIIELLGGKIWFESAPETGTIFRFTIPNNA